MSLMKTKLSARDARRTASVLLAMAMLGACAIPKDLRLETQGPGLPADAAVAIQTAPLGDPVAERFAGALAAAFAARGHDITSTAPVTAVFSFTRRDRAIGAADGAVPASSPVWISRPARRSLFQGCKGERLRATLALYARGGDALIHRASGEIDGCSFTEADLDNLAQALVAGRAP